MPIQHAAGKFNVTLTREPAHDTADGIAIGRAALDKQFHGELEASSSGVMLSAVTPVKGSAAYVAIERVVGKLHGRSGSFVLQHNGTMTRGQPALEVSVVPDSGTAELAGISGKMSIDIVDGAHLYKFEYVLDTPG